MDLRSIFGNLAVDDGEVQLPPEIQQAAIARMDRGGPPQKPDLGVEDVLVPRAKPGIMRSIWAAMAREGGASPEAVERVKDPQARERAAGLRVKQAKLLFPNDPMAQMLWVQGDDTFREQLGKRYEDKVVAEGSSIARNGGEVYRNKQRVVGEADGVGYHGDDETGLKWGDRRQRSHSEDETTRHNRADEATERQKVDQEGVAADAKADTDDAKASVQKVLRKAATGGMLSPAEQVIFDAAIQKMKGGDQSLFGAEDDDDEAMLPPGPSTPAGGTVDPRRISSGLGRAKPAAAKAPAAQKLDPRLQAVPDGGTFRAKGSDGKVHRWRKSASGVEDLGVVG